MFASFIPEIMDIVGKRERYGGTYDKPVGVRYSNIYHSPRHVDSLINHYVPY